MRDFPQPFRWASIASNDDCGLVVGDDVSEGRDLVVDAYWCDAETIGFHRQFGV
jgi:hypothetical protein